MTDSEILALKSRVKRGDVFWHAGQGQLNKVLLVTLAWIEFPDEPELIEPAARMANGVYVALRNSEACDFVTLHPALSECPNCGVTA